MALEGKIRYLRRATKPRRIERPEDVKEVLQAAW